VKNSNGEGRIVEGPELNLTEVQVERARDLAIVRSFNKGTSPALIAQFFGIHRSTVYRIVERVPLEAVENDGPTLTLG
jgi:transposase